MTARTQISIFSMFLLLGCALACEKAPPEPEPKPVETVAEPEQAEPEPEPEPPKELKAPDNVAAPPKEAERTDSGLASLVLKKGSGKVHPKPTDTVKVHYTGWTKDGKMFDSSVQRGEPSSFALNAVIKGWTEGVQLMTAGEKRRFWIPGDLAYGDTPARPGAPAGQLTFDIELLEIEGK